MQIAVNMETIQFPVKRYLKIKRCFKTIASVWPDMMDYVYVLLYDSSQF